MRLKFSFRRTFVCFMNKHCSYNFATEKLLCVISGFRREVAENCALLGCYAASSGHLLPTFLDIRLQGSRIQKKASSPNTERIQGRVWSVTGVSNIGATGFVLDFWTVRMGPIGCPETSVRNYHCWLRSNPEERSSQKELLIHSPSVCRRVYISPNFLLST